MSGSVPQHYQVPNILLQFPNLNWQDILVFGAMNIAKNKDTYEAKISQGKLAEILKVDRRKIARHIQHLLDAPVILFLRKEGRCKVYQMPKKYSHFECFSPEFIKDPNLSFEEKAYLISSQQFYILNEDNTLASTISNFKMCDKLKMSPNTIYKITDSLQDKGLMIKVPTNSKDLETGLKKDKYILFPEKYEQALLFVLKKHEEDIDSLKKENIDLKKAQEQMQNEIVELRNQIKELTKKDYTL